MKITIFGAGKVGGSLSAVFASHGHDICIGSDNPQSKSANAAIAENPNYILLPVKDAIANADVIFLATPFMAAEQVLKGISFSGRILVDCTNPVGAGLTHGLQSTRSGSEVIQELVPDAKVVKAFTIYGYETFSGNMFMGSAVPPAMLIAGNDSEAKKVVAELVKLVGFEAVDTGTLDRALHLEHMTLLWVKMVRMGGHSSKLAWATLR